MPGNERKWRSVRQAQADDEARAGCSSGVGGAPAGGPLVVPGFVSGPIRVHDLQHSWLTLLSVCLCLCISLTSGLDVDLQGFCFSSSLLDVFCFPSLCSTYRVSLLFASLHSVARSFRGEHASVVEEDHNHRCDKTCYNILFPSVMM
jgi:hypothetical protein